MTAPDSIIPSTATALSQFIQKTHGLIASIQMVHIICLACVFALGLALALNLRAEGSIPSPSTVCASDSCLRSGSA